MSTMVDTTFLQRICWLDPREHWSGAPLNVPYAITIDGERWAYGTDGYQLVAIKTESLLPDADEHKAPQIGSTIQPLPDGKLVSLASLKAWSGPPTWPDMESKPIEVDCDRCEGDRFITGECDSCGRDEDQRCPECNGTGKVLDGAPLWPDERYGVLLGKVVEMERFARCLDTFTDETVMVGHKGEHGPIWVWTDQWVVLVAGKANRRPDGLPVFTGAEVAHV